MRKKLTSLALALVMGLALCVPASAASLPMAEPEPGTSVASVSVSADTTDYADNICVEYVFVIDRQGVLWQYKSAVRRTDAKLSGGFEKKQVASGVRQIGESGDGIGILRSDGKLSYLHLMEEEKLYDVASGVARLMKNQYFTTAGEHWQYYWDNGGAHVVTPEGVKREREPGLKTTLLGSGRISFADGITGDCYITEDHVLHYTYRRNGDPQKVSRTLNGMQTVVSGYAGPVQSNSPAVLFAVGVNGDLYARGINTSGFVGNGGKYDAFYAEFWGDIRLDIALPAALEVYDMVHILKNVDRAWTSDRAYALDRDGNYWTWGDPNESFTATVYSTPPADYDGEITYKGKPYCADFDNYPLDKPYAAPRKMQAGETVSMLSNYRQGADGTVYVKLGRTGKGSLWDEYALPHTGGVLGGDLTFTVGGTGNGSGVSGGFADVKPGDWFAEPVQWAVKEKITNGTSATAFSPKQDCTVAQILTFLWRASGSPKPDGENPFRDVKAGDWFADAAVWAHEEGMVDGDTFRADTPCTRSMAVTYLWKAAGSPEAKAASFSDVPASADCAQAVNWAVEQGVTDGTSAEKFSPDTVCTRGHIVTFLYRAFAE